MTLLVADQHFAAPEQFQVSDDDFAMGLKVVAIADGGFVAVWEQGVHLVGQRFDRHGAPVGNRLLIKGDEAPAGSGVELAPLAGGGFVATWQNFIVDGPNSRWRTEYRLFDAAGQPLGPLQSVSTAHGQNPSVAALEGSGFVIAFSSPDGDGTGIRAQRFDGQGAKVGGEIAVNTTTAGNQHQSLAAGLPGGGFLVAWLNSSLLRGQIFNSSGQKVGTEFDVAPHGVLVPNLASLPSGNVVVIYSGPGLNSDLMARILTPTGAVAVADFQVNTSTAGTQYWASIAVLPTGEFLITWRDATFNNQTGHDGDVKGQLFAADGSRIGGEFLVNNVTENSQMGPASIAFGSGDVATLWIDHLADPSWGRSWNTTISARLLFSPTFGTEGADNLAGTPERDYFYALGGDDIVTGADLADGLDGGEGNDSLDGGAGNDVLVAGAGTDVLTGGEGDDSLYFGASYTAGDIAAAGTGRDVLVLQGNYAAVLSGAGMSGLEAISVQSGATTKYGDTANNFYDYSLAFADAVVAAGQQMIVNAQSLRVGEEFVFDGSAETDGSFFVHGGRGNDILRGGAGHDTLLAGAGTDRLIGGGGNDTLYFGRDLSGGDSADGGAGSDVLVLQGNYIAGLASVGLTGIEAISLQSGARTSWGDTANHFYDYNLTMADTNVAAGQQLIVNAQSLRAGEDLTFDGSAETDGSFLVYGGHGVDDLTGGAGNDVFFFEGSRWGAGDTVDGGGGQDAIVISSGSGLNRIVFSDSSFTGIEAISLNARYATDPTRKPNYDLVLADGNVAPGGTLIVNAGSIADGSQFVGIDGRAVTGGNLILFGGAGHDTLMGGGGADQIVGGRGKDSLTGGGGADVFRYDASAESSPGSVDLIGDFAVGTDKIDLSRIDANTAAAGDQAFTWIGSNAFSGSAGELRAYYQNGLQWIAGDTNGDGTADLLIAFQSGVAPLGAGDFLL